jgi:ATP-dependent RNA/DNA helicase IGHMBP2
VSISENNVPASQLSNSDHRGLLTGTVTKVTSQSVFVAVDSDLELLDEQLNESGTYKLIKLCNDVTYKRVRTAMENLRENKLNEPCMRMADVLFLKAKPEKHPQSLHTSQLLLPHYNDRLDSSQLEAVAFAFEQKELAIVHGPPGTGKTTTLVEIIKQSCLRRKMKLLCCAPSNIAVDNLVERLARPRGHGERLRMVRLGHPARLLEHIQEYSLDAVVSKSEQCRLANDVRAEIDNTYKAYKKWQRDGGGGGGGGGGIGEREQLKRQMRELRKELAQREERAVREVLRECDCVLATLSTCQQEGPLKHIEPGNFDMIVIDECSQSTEAACWIALERGARKLLIAGDHLQLPPTILSKEAAERGLDLTLMKRLIDAYGDQCTRMLTVQYRMNERIAQWISERLYSGKLEAHASVRSHLLCDLAGVERDDECTAAPLVLVDTDGCDMAEMVATDGDGDKNDDEQSKANEGEANLVCAHVRLLCSRGLRPQDVAVITPYNLQMELIKTKLAAAYPQVEVKSVDGFQGREKEAIVLSLVRSNNSGQVGFLADQRRINVAVTRARRHLCIVCDARTCKSNEFLRSFLEYVEANAVLRSPFDYEAIYQDESEGGESKSFLNDFENIKFHKLKFAATKSATKKPAGSSTKSDKLKLKSKGKQSETADLGDIKQDQQFMDDVMKIVDKLKSSLDLNASHSFGTELSARQRRLVHEIAEKCQLSHVSVGENDSRHIILSVAPVKLLPDESNQSASDDGKILLEEKKEIEKEEEEEEEEEKEEEKIEKVLSINEINTSETKKAKPKTKTNQKGDQIKSDNPNAKEPKKPHCSANANLLGELDNQEDMNVKYRNDASLCPHCGKYILKISYLMHELHCSKVNNDTVKSKLASSSMGEKSQPKKEKAASKLKVDPIKNATTDDFDELVDKFARSNTTCFYRGCKTSVKTLGENCEFCRNRFCLTHSIAEV